MTARRFASLLVLMSTAVLGLHAVDSAAATHFDHARFDPKLRPTAAVAVDGPVIARDGDELIISGTVASDIFAFHGSGTTWTFEHSLMFSFEPPEGWVVSGTPACDLVDSEMRAVECDGTGVARITFILGGYDDPQGDHVNLFASLPPPSPVVRVIGGPGPDGLNALHYSGRTRLKGAAGQDNLTGSMQRDFALGGSGKDKLFGSGGNDFLAGDEGNDALFGDKTSRITVEDGVVGKDTLDGGDGNDLMDGGSGQDLLFGWSGDDRLFGANGSDSLVGHDGDDRLLGGEGSDQLAGDPGRDVLYAGPGRDFAHTVDRHDDDVNCGAGVDSVQSDWRDLTFRCEHLVE